MAIASTGIGSIATVGQGTSLNPTLPTGADATIVVLIRIALDSTATITAPTGWTVVDDTANGTDIRGVMYWALGDVSSSNFTFSQSSGIAYIEGFSGADTTTPSDVAGAGQTNSSASITAPAITTFTDGAMVVNMASIINQTTGAAHIAPPSGMTESGEGAVDTQNNNNWVHGAGSRVIQATAGDTGTKVATADTTGENVGQLWAIRPEAAADAVLTGDVDAVAAVTGAAEQTHVLTGSIPAVAAATGTVEQIHQLASDVESVVSVTGVVEQIHQLTAAVDVVGSVSGAAEQIHQLTGDVEAVVAMTGVLTVTSEAAGILAHFATMI